MSNHFGLKERVKFFLLGFVSVSLSFFFSLDTNYLSTPTLSNLCCWKLKPYFCPNRNCSK